MAIYKLGELGSFKSGINKIYKNKWNKGNYFLNYSDINENFKIKKENIGNLKKYDFSSEEWNLFNLKYGDIIFTRSGTKTEIGKSTVYLTYEKTIFSGFSKRYRLNDFSILNPIYSSYYFRSKNFRNIVIESCNGTTFYNISGKIFENLEINVPSLEEQQKIIDIIEPLEKLNNHINFLLSKMKLLMVKNYSILKSSLIPIKDLIILNNDKRNLENDYFATNAFGELYLDTTKIIEIKDKAPSRANLKPKDNSIILSKLDGENKLFYFKEKPNYIISTGFFNITTNYIDWLISFFLSEDFKKQKTLLSTGTTMVGLNNDQLLDIQIKKPIDNSNTLSIAINKLIDLNINLEKLKDKYINLLIK